MCLMQQSSPAQPVPLSQGRRQRDPNRTKMYLTSQISPPSSVLLWRRLEWWQKPAQQRASLEMAVSVPIND